MQATPVVENPTLGWLGRIQKNAHVHAAVLLLIVLSVFYRDVVFFGRTFLMLGQTAGTMATATVAYGYPGPALEPNSHQVHDPGALAWVVEPYEFHSRECFRRGEWPLWNPYSSMGQPHIGSGHAGVLDPLCLPVYLAPRSLYPLAYDFEVLLRIFIAGFFTYLFLRRLALSWWPACFGGAAFLLMNYGIDVGNHSSFKVFAMMPALFYAVERLRTAVRFRNAVGCAVATAMLVLADFPEAAFISLQFVALYLLSRSAIEIWNSENRVREALRQAGIFVLAFVPGLILTTPVILPLIENVLSGDPKYHGDGSGSGAGAWPLRLWILTIIPYYAGPPGVGWAPHFHDVVIVLALTSLFTMNRASANKTAFIFFTVYFIVFFAKMFGIKGTNWIAQLPVYRQVFMCRYLTATFEFSLAGLAAFGLEQHLNRKPTIHTVFGGSLLLAAFFSISLWFNLGGTWDASVFFKQLIKLIAVVSIFLGFLVAADKLSWPRRRTAIGCIVCLVFELLVWHKNVGRPLRWDPFEPPPYARFLKEQSSPFRTFAGDCVLYPNTFIGQGLEDIRHVSAIEPARRAAFISGLFLPEYAEFRLTGSEPVQRNQFFDLVNTKYVLVRSFEPRIASIPLSQFPHFAEAFQTPTASTNATLNVDGRNFAGIYMSSAVKRGMELQLPDAPHLALSFAIALDPHSWDEPADSAEFAVYVKDAVGEHEVFRRTLDPKAHASDRRWINGNADLSPWSGKIVELELAAAPVKNATSNVKAEVHGACWAMPVLAISDEAPNDWGAPNVKAPPPSGTVSLYESYLDQNVFAFAAGMRRWRATIAGDARDCIFMHAPGTGDVRFHVPDSAGRIKFGIALDPNCVSDPPVGDGAGFHLKVRDGETVTEVFSQYIDPKHNPAERRWISGSADLSRWRGHDIELTFSTDPGPANDNVADWALWSGFDVEAPGVSTPPSTSPHQFDLVYDKEISIFRNNNAFPRAFVVHAIDQVGTYKEAVTRMQQPDFNAARIAVIDGPEAPGDAALKMPAKDWPKPSSAEVTRHTTNTVSVTARLDKPGLLVLSETYFPGWHAYVDGKEAPIYPTDVLLRGVYLEAGNHTVEFVYWPRSFVRGLYLAASVFAAFIAWAAWNRWRRTRFTSNAGMRGCAEEKSDPIFLSDRPPSPPALLP